jgi:prepilin signal peptidase PulO-like enzyme (type II secretory pathway)
VILRYRTAPLDRAALIRTACTLAGLLGLLVLIYFIHQLAPPIMLLDAPLLAFPALAYASSAEGYAVDTEAIYIQRRAMRTLRIPYSRMTAVRPFLRPAVSGAIRIYGTGGLFGWAGRYRFRGVGGVSMHATNLDCLVLIQRARGRPLLISPLDPGAFLNGIRRQFETIEVTARPG